MAHVNPEMGRELSVPDLLVETAVVLGREDRPSHFLTVWVAEIGQDFVTFTSGNSALIVRIREDGKLTDDSGAELLMYEYRGFA